MRLIFVLIVLLLASVASAQTPVEYAWIPPDSTLGNPDAGIPPQPIPDGYVVSYEIFKATPSDTLFYSEILAPIAVADTVKAIVVLDLDVPTSIAVRATDKKGRTGPLSEWSTAFTVEPGPPGSPARPEPIRIILGG